MCFLKIIDSEPGGVRNSSQKSACNLQTDPTQGQTVFIPAEASVTNPTVMSRGIAAKEPAAMDSLSRTIAFNLANPDESCPD